MSIFDHFEPEGRPKSISRTFLGALPMSPRSGSEGETGESETEHDANMVQQNVQAETFKVIFPISTDIF